MRCRGRVRPEETRTGDAAILDTPTPGFVADDPVNYDFVERSLKAPHKCKNDSSVHTSVVPGNRMRVVEL